MCYYFDPNIGHIVLSELQAKQMLRDVSDGASENILLCFDKVNGEDTGMW